MNELNKDQQKELVEHLRGIMSGEIPMQHPGAPQYRPGQKYEGNSVDESFEREMRSGIFRAAFVRSFLWGAMPAILFNIPQVRTSWLFRNQKSPVPSVLLCGFLGYGKGILEGSNIYAKQRFQLEGSPISRETRYKVHEMCPHHSWLRGFEHEFENVNRRAQMRDNRRGGAPRFGDSGSGSGYRYDEPPRRFDDHRRPASLAQQDEDGFSMDDWFHGGSEGGRIPPSNAFDDDGHHPPPSSSVPSRNSYHEDRRNRFRNNDEEMSKGNRYQQDRRNFDKERERREEYDRSSRRTDSYDSRRSSDPYSSRRGGGVYGQRDEDFVTQADFETDDDKFVSGRPSRDGW